MSQSIPAYAVAQLKVKDADTFFSDYVVPLQSINEKYGAEVLAASQHAEVIEGDYECNLTVVLKFPSAEKQAHWYGDFDYQPLIRRRRELTDTDASRRIIVPALGRDAS